MFKIILSFDRIYINIFLKIVLGTIILSIQNNVFAIH